MAVAKIILYESKTLSDDSHPIMLRVAHKKTRRLYSLEMSATSDKWQGTRFKNNRSKNKILADIDKKVSDIMEGFNEQSNPFTYAKFEKLYKGNQDTTLFKYFDTFITDLKNSNQTGTAIIFQETLNSLKDCFKKDCSLQDIDIRFINRYVRYYRERGVKDNTIYLRVRVLRQIINSAIGENYLKVEYYPFRNQQNPKGFKVSKLKGDTTPRALKKSEIEKIRDLDLMKYPHLRDARNMFMFSYYGMGINFADMARLTIDNIKNDRIQYTRKKTKKNYNIKLIAPAIEILLEYDYPSKHYIFPILNEDIHKTEIQKIYRIKKLRRRFNDDLKTIAGIVKIDPNLTSYYARHSFATNARFEGFSDALISEALGHTTEKTTKEYLDSFGKEYLDEMQEKLL